MKTDEMNLTVAELEQLCRLYMDCELSLLEEKELEYVLSHTSLTTSPIEEVRRLMGIRVLPVCSSEPERAKRNWDWRLFSGIAASIALLVSVAFYLVSPQGSMPDHNVSTVYVAAYSHGQRLNGHDAATSIDIAMAKADSLMNYAALAERDFMMKANDIISQTFNN